MKKLFYIISIIAGLYSCEQNLMEEIVPEQVASTLDEKIPMTFQITFPELIDYGTDLVPMSRAVTDDTIKSLIRNEYKAIIMKKINEQWFVDTVIKEQRIDKDIASYISLKIRDNTSFSPLRIDLRPGIYKMTLFLGVSDTDFNKELKKGFLVSPTPDLVPGRNLPVAVYAHIAGTPIGNDPPEGTYCIAREIFAGTVSFAVSKDPDLTTKGANIPLNVALQRKVSRYRFLLKKTEKYPVEGTAYRIKFVLKATDMNNPFCNGLDVLGGSYYDVFNPFREISLLETTTYFHQSPQDNQLYHMSETANGGSTNFGPFIIMDKPISFELSLPLITGQSPGPSYECKEVIPLTFYPNSLLTNVFFQSDSTLVNEQEKYTFKYLEDPNANRLFDPYYEWNAYHKK